MSKNDWEWQRIRNLLAGYNAPPCYCGTGRYCHRHLQYGLEETEGKRAYSVRSESAQRCGGGRRIRRKLIKGS